MRGSAAAAGAHRPQPAAVGSQRRSLPWGQGGPSFACTGRRPSLRARGGQSSPLLRRLPHSRARTQRSWSRLARGTPVRRLKTM